jgi:hypothetical protein
MLTLAGWGALDQRLSRRARIVLVLAPLFHALMWVAMSLWSAATAIRSLRGRCV